MMLVTCVTGSHLYGLATETSDTDLRSVMFEPNNVLLGLDTFNQRIEQTGATDAVTYGLRHFIKLALMGDPNMLDILFCPPSHRTLDTPVWQELYEMRHVFLAKTVTRPFFGFVGSEMQRINVPCSNSSRAAAIAKNGYDVKAASHVLRLLFNLSRILGCGSYSPVLEEADKRIIMQVKQGGMQFEDFIEIYEVLLKQCQSGERVTELPDTPDTCRIDEWLLRTYASYVVSPIFEAYE